MWRTSHSDWYGQDMTQRPTDRVQITGLTPDQAALIRDAAHWSRLSIKDYVLAQAAATMNGAQKVILNSAEPGGKE